MKKVVIVVAVLISIVSYAQETSNNTYKNHVERLIGKNVPIGVSLGGYAQIDYNEKDGAEAGKLDVHRMILFVGYKFNEKVSFLTEIEYEHVNELYVEQAYLKYKVNESVNVLAGLLLVPMGIVNEFHEPTTFYGVERPNVDKYVIPTTWRELGIGVSGNLNNLSLKYQAYIFNGFISYIDGVGGLRGSDGLRSGRQKGADSTISSPNLSMKFDYYGIPGLRVGLAGYFGKTQTDDTSIEAATVGVSMIGLDARYKYNNLELRGQYISTTLDGTEEYNALPNTPGDLGSKINGYYGEVAYGFDLKGVEKLTPFVRYEKYNTQAATEGALVANKAYDRNDIIFGLNYKVANGAAFKVDYQISDNAKLGSDVKNQFNAGVAIWF
tara:strand:- start:24360 stop:25505 length:1146 start_codon:yes stop_codon:yes gene_type:complete